MGYEVYNSTIHSSFTSACTYWHVIFIILFFEETSFQTKFDGERLYYCCIGIPKYMKKLKLLPSDDLNFYYCYSSNTILLLR